MDNCLLSQIKKNAIFIKNNYKYYIIFINDWNFITLKMKNISECKIRGVHRVRMTTKSLSEPLESIREEKCEKEKDEKNQMGAYVR